MARGDIGANVGDYMVTQAIDSAAKEVEARAEVGYGGRGEGMRRGQRRGGLAGSELRKGCSVGAGDG